MRRDRLRYARVLTLSVAGWGIAQPLSKIAVSEGHRHLGIIFRAKLIRSENHFPGSGRRRC